MAQIIKFRSPKKRIDRQPLFDPRHTPNDAEFVSTEAKLLREVESHLGGLFTFTGINMPEEEEVPISRIPMLSLCEQILKLPPSQEVGEEDMRGVREFLVRLKSARHYLSQLDENDSYGC